jgi:CO dehydrogenase maturation factor
MPDKRIIVVAGKGGVGKTTVTALLVDALTRAGVKSMLVVDSDPALNLHYSLLGLNEPPGTPLASVINEIDLSARAIRALDVPLNEHVLRTY